MNRQWTRLAHPVEQGPHSRLTGPQLELTAYIDRISSEPRRCPITVQCGGREFYWALAEQNTGSLGFLGKNKSVLSHQNVL